MTPTVVAADYDTLMREGVSFRRSGDDLSALKRFQQAYELDKTPRALAQIGLAEQALGRWAAADTHLRQALESKGDPWIRKNRATIDNALLVVASHVGQLEVSGSPPGAEVRVDGELVGQLPLARPITVTAGGIAVEVRAPGYLPIMRAAAVSAQTLTRENFTLQSLSRASDQRPPSGQGSASTPNEQATSRPPDPGATSSSSPALPGPGGGPAAGGEQARPDASAGASDTGTEPATRAGGSLRVFALVSGGIAVASLAFGIFEHVSWQQKVSSFGSMTACGDTFPDKGGAGCKQLHDEGLRARQLAFVGYGVTAAFAAGAIVLFLIAPDRSAEPSSVACAPTTMGPGLGCALRF